MPYASSFQLFDVLQKSLVPFPGILRKALAFPFSVRRLPESCGLDSDNT